MTFRRSITLATLVIALSFAAGARTIPAGSRVTVRINTSLSSATAHKEQRWSGTLTSNIVAGVSYR